MNKKDIAIEYAKSFIGVDYLWGGETPHGFDCSGLIQEVLASVGLDPRGDQTANALYETFKANEVQKASKACIAFWPKVGRKYHVAICLDSEHIIEAGGGNSKTINSDMAKKQKAFVRIRPLDNRGDNYTLIDIFS